MALLDSHYLTTRSNTFTAYVTLYDRENPESSVLSQVTLDRTNLLPRLVLKDDGSPLIEDTADGYKPVILRNDDASPRVITEQRCGYYDTRMDN